MQELFLGYEGRFIFLLANLKLSMWVEIAIFYKILLLSK